MKKNFCHLKQEIPQISAICSKPLQEAEVKNREGRQVNERFFGVLLGHSLSWIVSELVSLGQDGCFSFPSKHPKPPSSSNMPIYVVFWVNLLSQIGALLRGFPGRGSGNKAGRYDCIFIFLRFGFLSRNLLVQ